MKKGNNTTQTNQPMRTKLFGCPDLTIAYMLVLGFSMVSPSEICASKSLNLLQNPNLKVVYNLSIKSWNSNYKKIHNQNQQTNNQNQTLQP